MAHKKAAGSTQLGRDSQGQRLGVKIADGSFAKTGEIIVRQRGTRIHPGRHVRRASDDTLYAQASGFVVFTSKKAPNFHGKLSTRRYANIKPKA